MRVSPPLAYARSVVSVLELEWDHPLEYMLRDGKQPYDKPATCISAQYNWAREHVLHNGYDALLTVEADIIVPPDALKRLVACDADVAMGTYVFRRGKQEWNAYDVVEAGSGRSISETPERARELWGQVVDVAGVGLGLALISRKALEIVGSFEPWVAADYDCDWTLSMRAQEHGLIQRADLGLLCGHITQTPSLRILWPDMGPLAMFRVEYLNDGWFNVTPDGNIEIVVSGFYSALITKQQLARAVASEKYRKAVGEN